MATAIDFAALSTQYLQYTIAILWHDSLVGLKDVSGLEEDLPQQASTSVKGTIADGCEDANVRIKALERLPKLGVLVRVINQRVGGVK
jgi:hypothetical protein